jgi:hypothetical protein
MIARGTGRLALQLMVQIATIPATVLLLGGWLWLGLPFWLLVTALIILMVVLLVRPAARWNQRRCGHG